jgi:hypothetical protein
MMTVALMIFMFGGAVPSGLGRKCHVFRHLRAGLSRFAPLGLVFRRIESRFSPGPPDFDRRNPRASPPIWRMTTTPTANSLSNSKDRECAGTLPALTKRFGPDFGAGPKPTN